MVDQYQIRVKGHLDSCRLDWLDDFTVTHEPDGATLIVGPVIDQPALYGLLKRIRDLGVPLLLVEQLNPKI